MDLLATAEKAVLHCEKKGVEAEAIGIRIDEIIVTVERNDVKLCIKQESSGVGIRTLRGNSVGFASCNTLDEKRVKETAEKAVNMAGRTPPLPFVRFASPGPLPDIEGVYDPGIHTFREEDAVLTAQNMVRAATEDPRVAVDSGEFAASLREKSVFTSTGIAAAERRSRFSWFIFGMAREGTDVGSFVHQYGCCTRVSDMQVEKSAQLLGEEAVANLHPEKIDSFSGDIILGPDAVSNLIGDPVTISVNANNVYRGQSVLAQKRGTQIASEVVTLQDNAILPRDASSSAFDREGTPHQNVTIVENGVLKQFLYDSLAANREGQPPTGNATGNCRELPKIGITHFVMGGKTRPLDTILEETDKGLLLSRFSGTSDYVSGDFSGAAKGAQFIQSGEITHPVKEATIAGNVFEVLPTISDISKEHLRYSHMTLPYVKVPDMQIIA